MSTQRPLPDVGNQIREFIEEPASLNSDTLEVLVGLDENLDGGVEQLQALLEEAEGTISKDIGFGIYKISIPVEGLEELAAAEILEYIEYSDPEGSPSLMGN